ncbi:hypothetical protein PSEUBRA_004887 [Kalmanozyma brasiliensis GHG001]|uniref:uncharacterized protein n=1 Tax=Kalmanozyma brasiliensis (strain GHG001) TaxID=1365824 RepID=UPI002867B18E|nr:uncharacterized protein PSEUBRA_004887 [Kalmanozyma brasiliensis GHG001]KAF6767452.1 hypothetical protein PSEUBRA_004887 [Kalmanozyma brasiliensis GHG001]
MSSSNEQPDSVSSVSAGIAQITIDRAVDNAVPNSDATAPAPSTHDAIKPLATKSVAMSSKAANASKKTEPELTDAELRRLTMFLLRKLDEKISNLYHVWGWTDIFKDCDDHVIDNANVLLCWAHQLRDLIVERDPELKSDMQYWRDHQFRACGEWCRSDSIRDAAAKKPEEEPEEVLWYDDD